MASFHVPTARCTVSVAASVGALPSLFVKEEQLTPAVLASVFRLEGRISEAEMIEMNSRAKQKRVRENHLAAEFLRDKLGLSIHVEEESLFRYLLRLTGEHLLLVVISLSAAVVVAVPLGVLAAKRPVEASNNSLPSRNRQVSIPSAEAKTTARPSRSTPGSPIRISPPSVTFVEAILIRSSVPTVPAGMTTVPRFTATIPSSAEMLKA